MIELVLGSIGVQRLRFAISPLEEAMGAIEVILGHRTHPPHLPWLRCAATRAQELPLAELFRVFGAKSYRPPRPFANSCWPRSDIVAHVSNPGIAAGATVPPPS
ncbi:MAG TPA: hypothetical protein VGG05_26010 [Pseudonocardiaceae bacterium]